MKVAVVGLGAIGGLMLAWLARSDAALQVSALVRGATLEAVRSHGLRCLSGNETVHVPASRLRSSAQAAELGPQDLLILAVKAPALPGLAAQLAPLLSPRTTVLVAMNGVPWWFFDHLQGAAAGLRLRSVDPGDVVRAALPTAQALGCVVHLSASVQAPGVVRHGVGNGLIVGEPAGGRSARLDAVEGLLSRAGFAVTASPCIQRDIWFKLWGNMTMNPVSALTQASADRILDDPLARGFISAVMREAQDIGARIGCAIDQAPEERHAVTRKLGAFKTSMLQDLEAGRPLELDALVGAVREIGLHLGLATPNIDALFGLARLLGQSRGLYAAND
jgi:2-dehydropantoate 2-reductase